MSMHELYSKKEKLLGENYNRGILPPNGRKTKLHVQDVSPVLFPCCNDFTPLDGSRYLTYISGLV